MGGGYILQLVLCTEMDLVVAESQLYLLCSSLPLDNALVAVGTLIKIMRCVGVVLHVTELFLPVSLSAIFPWQHSTSFLKCRQYDRRLS